ncbi:MAG: hypothetical protein ACLQGU_08035, partial [bacterium]
MKKRLLGLILAVLVLTMCPFVINASGEEGSASTSDKKIEEVKPVEEAKPPEAPAPEPGLLMFAL